MFVLPSLPFALPCFSSPPLLSGCQIFLVCYVWLTAHTCMHVYELLPWRHVTPHQPTPGLFVRSTVRLLLPPRPIGRPDACFLFCLCERKCALPGRGGSWINASADSRWRKSEGCCGFAFSSADDFSSFLCGGAGENVIRAAALLLGGQTITEAKTGRELVSR